MLKQYSHIAIPAPSGIEQIKQNWMAFTGLEWCRNVPLICWWRCFTARWHMTPGDAKFAITQCNKISLLRAGIIYFLMDCIKRSTRATFGICQCWEWGLWEASPTKAENSHQLNTKWTVKILHFAMKCLFLQNFQWHKVSIASSKYIWKYNIFMSRGFLFFH